MPILSETDLFILALGALGLGIMLLVRGGTWTIDGAVYVAERAGVSHLLIGFTIVAFGTSFPEMIVSVNANIKNVPGIALGNVIGSNIANILLVIGASALFAPLIMRSRFEVMRDVLAMLAATIWFGVLLIGDSGITRLSAATMLLALVAYTAYQYFWARKKETVMNEAPEVAAFNSIGRAMIILVMGFLSIALGAEILVRSASIMAMILGVPEAVVALSVIAIGTSLPELSTCIAACMRRQSDLVLGNIIGSNVFNILMIIGVAVLIKPISAGAITPQLVALDMWVMGGTALIFGAWLFLKGQIGRIFGALALSAYVAYIGYIYLNNMNAGIL